jgi:hypothetical protein
LNFENLSLAFDKSLNLPVAELNKGIRMDGLKAAAEGVRGSLFI